MVQRDTLISNILKVLQRAGFATSDPKDLAHAGFDIVARRQSMILVIKVVLNANSLAEPMMASMKNLAGAVEGSALLIAVKSGDEAIEDDVAYSRSGVPLISSQTFSDLIEEGIPPMVYAASGGFYVDIDSEILRKAREGGLSLGDLADIAGVSRRSIRMYEDGMNAKLEVAMRLEKGLGVELILPLDPLNYRPGKGNTAQDDFQGIAREIFTRLNHIGYSVLPTARCPFDAVTMDKDVMLFTGVEQKRPGLDRRARAIANLSRVLGKHSVIFVDRLGECVNLEGTPLIGRGELKMARDKKKVMDLIEERV